MRRDGWQQPDDVLAALALPETAVIADVGAGGGYFTELDQAGFALVERHEFLERESFLVFEGTADFDAIPEDVERHVSASGGPQSP